MERKPDVAARTQNLWQVGFGLVLLLAGIVGMSTLMVITYGDSAACEAWAFRLGLALSLLLSAFAQLMILVGAWLLWRSRRRAA